MAGPMGGMMGAMLGQMIRPFNLEVFVPFFSFIILASLISLQYTIHCGTSSKKPSTNTKLIWAGAVLALLALSVTLSFSLEPTVKQNETKLPAYLQQLTKDVEAEAKLDGTVQKITINVAQSRYSPNVIHAKKGTLIMTFVSDETGGCAREVVIPDFKIKKIIPTDSPLEITLDLQKSGEFPFHCSMDMAKGRIIVT